MSADSSDWRAHFPILRQKSGESFAIYLDSAATTQRPVAVVGAITEFYERYNANPAAALHRAARLAAGKYEAARDTVAQFINANTADAVVWTRGTTESVNLVATAWAEQEFRAGDEILLTIAEHASNLFPWSLAARRVGAVVKVADCDAAGRIVLDDLVRKISRKTRLIAFSHVSNVAGYINPAEQICDLARRHGILSFVDAAQSAPHVPIDVRAMGCDFLAGRERIEAHERALVEHGLSRLRKIPKLRLLGPHTATHRLPVFSFAIEGSDAMNVMRFLDERGIAVRLEPDS